MKKFALLAFLFLTACNLSPQGMIDQGTLYMRETQRAAVEAERRQELEDARAREAAEWEIAGIQAASQATLSAWDMTITQADATRGVGNIAPGCRPAQDWRRDNGYKGFAGTNNPLLCNVQLLRME